MYILSIGSNQGDRISHLKNTINALNAIGKIESISSLYETPSWGYTGGDYLNLCASWIPKERSKDALDILNDLQTIEHALGRRRTAVQYTDRVIDIDIIAQGAHIHKHPRLEIPHAKMHLRKFVLIPLAEICPHFFHPILKRSISKLIETCEDTDEITRYGEL